MLIPADLSGRIGRPSLRSTRDWPLVPYAWLARRWVVGRRLYRFKFGLPVRVSIVDAESSPRVLGLLHFAFIFSCILSYAADMSEQGKRGTSAETASANELIKFESAVPKIRSVSPLGTDSWRTEEQMRPVHARVYTLYTWESSCTRPRRPRACT